MQLDKQELLKVLRTEGLNDIADKAESQLPDRVDTDQHQSELDSLGLDRTQLMAKLAAAGYGRTLSA